MGVDVEVVLEVEDFFPEKEAGVGGGGVWMLRMLGLSGDGVRGFFGGEFWGR